MFFCHFCKFRHKDRKDYADHYKYNHSHITKYRYCGFHGCEKYFSDEGRLTIHLNRTHRFFKTQYRILNTDSASNERGKFTCTVNLCGKEFDTFKKFLKHLKFHISNKQAVNCPYQKCLKRYVNLSSFTSHLTRSHKNYNQNQVIESNTVHCKVSRLESDDNNSENQIIEDHAVDLSVQNEENNIEDIEGTNHSEKDLFVQNIAQLYLKLESEFLIPTKNVEYINNAINDIYEQGQKIMLKNLTKSLESENFTLDKINQIAKLIMDHHPMHNTQKNLGTKHLCKTYYKNRFDYIEPVAIEIDEKKNTHFMYVPIKKTLKSVWKDKSVKNELKITHEIRDDDLLVDVTDGTVFKTNIFFKENPESLKIQLYQDSFEIVNPIGSARKKHKLLGIYMTILNLPDHLRSHVNSIKLVALCKEVNFNHEKVYGKIVDDLKIIENDGIKIGKKYLKGSVVCISGDNLGSHGLSGFMENFSTAKYWCRFCTITKDEFHSENYFLKICKSRSVDSYKEALRNKGTKNDYEGIKFNSKFNELKYYHVCLPGLPPCLGHDAFEGVIAYDLKLYIHYFIKKGWFTLAELNAAIESFEYSQEDKKDKPIKVSEKSERIIGNACQIWTLLRVLPLLIRNKIKDIHDEVWMNLLLLNEVTEIICAPKIHKSVLHYLKSCIFDYVTQRKLLFPNVNLRPKHHFLMHYPELILQFGPLIKVWTLRFESKHQYFKRAVRHMMNFINVTKTLSEKHELFQSLIRLGSDSRIETQMQGTRRFEITFYTPNIQTAIKRSGIATANIYECEKVIHKGTEYNKGNALVLRQDGYRYNVVIGRICMFLYEEDTVYVLFEVMENEFMPYLSAYQIYKPIAYECHRLQDILDFKPLHVYELRDIICVKPKCGFVCQQLQ